MTQAVLPQLPGPLAGKSPIAEAAFWNLGKAEKRAQPARAKADSAGTAPDFAHTLKARKKDKPESKKADGPSRPDASDRKTDRAEKSDRKRETDKAESADKSKEASDAESAEPQAQDSTDAPAVVQPQVLTPAAAALALELVAAAAPAEAPTDATQLDSPLAVATPAATLSQPGPQPLATAPLNPAAPADAPALLNQPQSAPTAAPTDLAISAAAQADPDQVAQAIDAPATPVKPVDAAPAAPVESEHVAADAPQLQPSAATDSDEATVANPALAQSIRDAAHRPDTIESLNALLRADKAPRPTPLTAQSAATEALASAGQSPSFEAQQAAQSIAIDPDGRPQAPAEFLSIFASPRDAHLPHFARAGALARPPQPVAAAAPTAPGSLASDSAQRTPDTLALSQPRDSSPWVLPTSENLSAQGQQSLGLALPGSTPIVASPPPAPTAGSASVLTLPTSSNNSSFQPDTGTLSSNSSSQRAARAEETRQALNAQVEAGIAQAVQRASIDGTGNSAVTIRLHPAHLGSLKIHIRMDAASASGSGGGGGVKARFEASSAKTKSILSGSLDSLRAALESKGMSVDEVSVSHAVALPERDFSLPPVPNHADPANSALNTGAPFADSHTNAGGARSDAQASSAEPFTDASGDQPVTLTGQLPFTRTPDGRIHINALA